MNNKTSPKISPSLYQLYLQHGGECLWNTDHRVPRPEGTTPATDEMFLLLEKTDELLQLIHTKMYSAAMLQRFQEELSALRHHFEEEVFLNLEQKWTNQ